MLVTKTITKHTHKPPLPDLVEEGQNSAEELPALAHTQDLHVLLNTLVASEVVVQLADFLITLHKEWHPDGSETHKNANKTNVWQSIHRQMTLLFYARSTVTVTSG